VRQFLFRKQASPHWRRHVWDDSGKTGGADATLIKSHADEARSGRVITWNQLHDIESAGTSRVTNDLMVTVRLALT